MNIVKSESSVKVIIRHPFRVRPNDPSDRLSLDFARRQGYEFLLLGDLTGEVHKPDGTVYTIIAGRCNCPDATDERRGGGSYWGHCKHSWWLSQLHTCGECGADSEMMDFETPYGVHSFHFVCLRCGDVRTVEEVLDARRRWRLETERQAEQKRQMQQGKAA